VALAAALAQVRAMLDVLGLDPLAANWVTAGADDDLHAMVGALVGVALDQRQAARDRKDWDAADAIRDSLLAAGVHIDDTPDGPRWTIER
jgi:cysteinyl-tRNA synthetase